MNSSSRSILSVPRMERDFVRVWWVFQRDSFFSIFKISTIVLSDMRRTKQKMSYWNWVRSVPFFSIVANRLQCSSESELVNFLNENKSNKNEDFWLTILHERHFNSVILNPTQLLSLKMSLMTIYLQTLRKSRKIPYWMNFLCETYRLLPFHLRFSFLALPIWLRWRIYCEIYLKRYGTGTIISSLVRIPRRHSYAYCNHGSLQDASDAE